MSTQRFSLHLEKGAHRLREAEIDLAKDIQNP